MEKSFRPLRNVFCDRDGTLIHDKHYLADPDGIELLPGVLPALQSLDAAGLRLFAVSNQSGIGRGMFQESDYQACLERLRSLLREGGVVFAEHAHCPHAPEEFCACRKPGPGMWERLRDAYGLKAEECAMIGDKAEDVAFGLNQGFAASVLVLTGKGIEAASRLGAKFPPGADVIELAPAPAHRLAPTLATPTILARDFAAAARWLLGAFAVPAGRL